MAALDIGVVEGVTLGLGALCFPLAAVLAFSKKPGGGSGTVRLPGVEITGTGSSVLFLLVGAALVFTAMQASAARAGEKQSDEGAIAAIDTSSTTEAQLARSNAYAKSLEEQLGKVSPAALSTEKKNDPKLEEGLPTSAGEWTGTLIRTQQREGLSPEYWPLKLELRGKIEPGAVAHLEWDLPESRKSANFTVTAIEDNVAILESDRVGGSVFRLKLRGASNGQLLLELLENNDPFSRSSTLMKPSR